MGVRQGCILCLTVLWLFAETVLCMTIHVPEQVDVYKTKSVRFAVAYAPNTTTDDVTVEIHRHLVTDKSETINIRVTNGSMPVVTVSGDWRNRARVTRDYNFFTVELSNVKVTDNGDYTVTITLNGKKMERPMIIAVLEKPQSIELDVTNSSELPYPENTLMEFVCSGVGGRPLGEIILARNVSGSDAYIPAPSQILKSKTNELTREFNVTFLVLLKRHDNASQYVCEIRDSPWRFAPPLLRSTPVDILVDWGNISATEQCDLQEAHQEKGKKQEW